jgi:hypothetical protein
LIVELSYTAQFYKYLRTFLDLPAGRTHVFKRSGGMDLTPEEVAREIAAVRATAAQPETLREVFASPEEVLA